MIADIPGLIEGASGGAGLGHEFLAHVERTRLLVHVLDLRPLDGSDPVANHALVERELELYDPRLAALPRVLALSKVDLVDEETGPGPAGLEATLGRRHSRDLTSSVTRAGLDELATELGRRIPVQPRERPQDADGRPAPPERAGRAPRVPSRGRRAPTRCSAPASSSFSVSGPGVERLVARYDLDNEDALAHLERRLRGIGVIRALEAEGFSPGTTSRSPESRSNSTPMCRIAPSVGPAVRGERGAVRRGAVALFWWRSPVSGGRRARGCCWSAPTTGSRASSRSIQAAVDAAKPGDWVLVGPGDYKTSAPRSPRPRRLPGRRADHDAADPSPRHEPQHGGRRRDQAAVAEVQHQAGRPGLRAGRLQAGPPRGLNGVLVWKADNVSVENLTVCNYLDGSATPATSLVERR